MARHTGKINAFFFKNRNKGIPNLMLYIGIANVVVYVLTLLNPGNPLFYNLFAFSYTGILRGEVWRLLSYPLNYLTERSLLWGLLSLVFYFYCGRVLEQLWGRLRFNLYYLTGILLTDAVALLIGLVNPATGHLSDILVSSYYVNLSLFLAVATIQPDAMVRVYFVIPLKMKWLAWVYFGLTLFYTIQNMVLLGFQQLAWLMPLVAVGNYFLFFGKQFTNVLPDFLRHPRSRAERKTAQNFRSATQAYRPPQRHSPAREAGSYRFRCTVCGRTDVSNPSLEFRYCSKCAGYRCYCIDHINNHAHISD